MSVNSSRAALRGNTFADRHQFWLICKASGVLNFAQGAILLLAALAFVSRVARGTSFAVALATTLVAMLPLNRMPCCLSSEEDHIW